MEARINKLTPDIFLKLDVSFYKKNGFEERPCEWDGPGVFKMIR